jgi:hypothetical protein
MTEVGHPATRGRTKASSWSLIPLELALAEAVS